MKNIIKTQKGITLIALVITIVVMLILAGISINLIIGENGIFTKTKEAREKFEVASVKEQLEMDVMATGMGETIDSTVYDYVQGLKDVQAINRLPYNSESDEVTASTTEAAVVLNGNVYIIYYDYYNKLKVEKEENSNTMMASRNISYLNLNDFVITEWFNTGLLRNQIETITFMSTNNVSEQDDVIDSSDITAAGHTPRTVMCWWKDTNDNSLYEIYIGAEGGVMAPKNCTYLLSNLPELTQINFGESFDTSNVEKMFGMIYRNVKLKSLDLSTCNFNTEKVTNMGCIFMELRLCETINLGNKFDTSNVVTMASMFNACNSLEILDLSQCNFNTINCTNMSSMFETCCMLESLNLGSNFDTTNVTNMNSMFRILSSLPSLDLGDKFNTINVTTMGSMFAADRQFTPGGIDNTQLKSIDLGDKFYTDNVGNMRGMFFDLDELEVLKLGNAFVNIKNGTDGWYIAIFTPPTTCKIYIKPAAKTWWESKFGTGWDFVEI